MTARDAARSIRVRRGRLEDLDQIKEFTRDTFSWGDYLPAAWAGWVRSGRGVLLVATHGSQIVGTCHLRLLEHREAWLEGLRVRHAFRKQGVASLLIQAVHDHAKKHNCRVIRLETASHNIAAQRIFEKFGYQFLIRYVGFKADASDSELGSVRQARASDLGTCWALWLQSWLKRSSKTTVPAPYGWRWWELTRKRLGDEMRDGRLWIAPGACMALRMEDDAFDITLLVGSKRGARQLLDAARALARRENKDHAFWLAPDVARSTEWATDAGYTLDEDGLLIYACSL